MWVDLLRPTGAAISALDETDRDAILEKVTTFDTFTPDNDAARGARFWEHRPQW